MPYPTKVTPETVELTKQLLSVEGLHIAVVANRVGVSTTTVHNIRNTGYNLENYRTTYLVPPNRRKRSPHRYAQPDLPVMRPTATLTLPKWLSFFMRLFIRK